MVKPERKAIVCKAVEEDLRLLRETFGDGAHNPDMWHKALLSLVFRLMSVEASAEALDIMVLIPRDRLVAILAAEIESDRFFGRMMYDLAELLVQQKIVSYANVGDVRPTQRVGSA